MKLHLACGERDFGPDWVHIDGGDFPHITYHSITDLSQYRNNEADLIYCSHALEYFDRDAAVMILNEWKRVLRPGGILRLAVPNFEVMADLYIENKVSLEEILGPLYGKMKMGDEWIYHKTTYDFDSLSSLLKEVGFKNIKIYNWRDTEHVDIDDQSKAHMPHDLEAIATGIFNHHISISLNIECVK